MRSTSYLLVASAAIVIAALAAEPAPAASMRTGIKIGEVTPRSCVVWTRTTDASPRGAAGSVRVSWRPADGSDAERSTAWVRTDPERDFTHQFKLDNLKAGADYRLQVEFSKDEVEATDEITGEFRTAPAADEADDVTFVVVTGQRNDTRDRGDAGHAIYDTMLRLGNPPEPPDFFVHTGDVVYYDKPGPDSRNAELARFRWNRMYSYPLQRAFHRWVASYFLKDDHDTLKNDCWPGQTYGDLTWEQGLAIFAEQTPAPDSPYRTVRWGSDLQVWLLEGREFRSPNTDPDGPQKTILGGEQLAWLERTLDASDATFRVVISATPIVGPDRSNKSDNHANRAFRHEGRRLRRLLTDRANVYVVCGDRHWQYASNDPATGLLEFCCGPTSDKHAGGFDPAWRDPAYHRFLRVEGGFLSVTAGRPEGTPRLRFRHHSVDGEVVHEEVHVAD